MASDSVPAGIKRGGDVSGCRSLDPEPPHPSDHSLLTFVLSRVFAVTMRRIAFSFQPSVFVCGAPCHASYLRIGKIGLFGGLPLGRDSHRPQSHCPRHLFSRRQEQERPRSSLPPLSSSTPAHPQLESVLKRTIQIVEPDYVGPRAPSIGFLLRMEGGRIASEGRPRGFTTEAVMVW